MIHHHRPRLIQCAGCWALLASIPSAAGAQSALPAVFVANNVSDDITSFTVNPDGTLTPADLAFSSDGPQTIDVSPDGSHLVVGHGTANEVTEVLKVFSIGTDASLTEAASTLVPNTPLDALWINDHIVAVTESTVSGPNFVHTYRFNALAGTLGEVDAVGTGSFNTAMALHPTGGILYAQDSTGHVISWFLVDQDGLMSPAGSLNTGATFPLKMAITPDASFLYAAGGISNGGHAVLGFSVGPGGGLLALGGSPFTSPGQSPAYVAVSADAAWLFVGHGTDATVRSFSIHPEDGSLAATGFSFDVGLQGTVGDVVVLGDLLLVTDESTAIDGIAGIYSFHINPDGSLTAVDGIYGTQGVRPESIAVWQPPASAPGDLDNDGTVGVVDLLILLGAWGDCPRPCPPACTGDIDGDCWVAVTDLLALLANWDE